MIENLNRLARRHLVIFITLRDRSLDVAATRYPESSQGLHRAIVAQRVEEERTIVLNRLRRMGLLTLEAQPTQIGPQLINRYLDVRRRERI